MGFAPDPATTADVLAIQRLVAAFPDAINSKDTDLFASLFAPDAVLEIVGMDVRLEGLEQVRAVGGALISGTYAFLVQLHGLAVPVVTGDTARGHVYGGEVGRFLDGSPLTAVGVYDDEYRRVDGAWHFARRTYSFLYRDQATPVPDAGRPVPALSRVGAP